MSADDSSVQIATNPFVYDASDLRALNMQVVRWWQLLLSIVIFGALVWFLVSIMLEEGFSWMLAGILFVILLLASGPWTWRPLLVQWSLRRQGLLEPMTIGIAPDCLVVHAARADARIKWSGIRSVKRRADRLFLFSSKRMAHIIPRRAFDSDAQFDVFAATAQEHWERQHCP